eukprot:234764_1
MLARIYSHKLTYSSPDKTINALCVLTPDLMIWTLTLVDENVSDTKINFNFQTFSQLNMHSYEECEQDPSTDGYYTLIIPLSVVVLLQFLLLIHTLMHWKELTKIPRSMFILFISVQLSALAWCCHYLLKYGILSLWFPNHIYSSSTCTITSYFNLICPPLFELLLLTLLLLRLDMSWKQTAQPLSHTCRIVLYSWLNIPIFILSILWLGFLDAGCYQAWTPHDVPHTTGYYCRTYHKYSAIGNITSYACMVWILVSNITFGCIFSLKLRRLLRTVQKTQSNSNSQINQQRQISLQSVRGVMVKNTVLTVLISVSTLFNWMLYFLGYGAVLVFLDVLFSCFLLSLMFEYNDKTYQTLTKPCQKCAVFDQTNHESSDQRGRNGSETSDSTNDVTTTTHPATQPNAILMVEISDAYVDAF